MKKVFALILTLAISFATIGAVVSFKKNNTEKAMKCATVALALTMLPAVLTQRLNSQLGLKSKDYFTDSPLDRPLSRAEKELWDYLTTVSLSGESKARVQTRELLLAGQLKIETYAESLMFTLPISSSGRRQILDASTSYAEGRIPQEWDRGSLPEGFLLAISTIGMGYATDATATVPEGDVDYVTQPNSWPAALRNSHVLISQNGSLIQKFASKFTGSQAASTNNAVEGDGLEFQKPFILEDVKSNLLELYHPAGQVMPATPAGLFLEIKLFGACVRPKN